LLPTTVAVAAVGITSLGEVNRRAEALYDDNVRTTQATSALWSGLYEAEETGDSQSRAQATYGDASSRISVAAVLVRLLIAMALVRNLVPRLRSYSSFAGRVADGRFGRGHQGGLEREPLLRCQVCGQLPDATTCEPLLVGGQ
jgi:hypothetical protein